MRVRFFPGGLADGEGGKLGRTCAILFVEGMNGTLAAMPRHITEIFWLRFSFSFRCALLLLLRMDLKVGVAVTADGSLLAFLLDLSWGSIATIRNRLMLGVIDDVLRWLVPQPLIVQSDSPF
jgi:hypothetical protein